MLTRMGSSLGLLFMLLLLCSSSYAESYEQCRERLNTPAKIGYFVKHNIKYCFIKEATPYRTAEEVFRSRSGGCTDIANFAYTMLVYHGYTAAVYEMWNDNRGHAFTVYVLRSGKYGAIDSIYGNQQWERQRVWTIAKLIYANYGGPTGMAYKKGFHDEELDR